MDTTGTQTGTMPPPLTDSAQGPRKDWRRAVRAVRGLVRDPKRTDLVFEIIDSLSGPAFERSYRRFRASPESARLLSERPNLIDSLRDREALAALPTGSLGRFYLEFVNRGGLLADGLLTAEEEAASHAPARAAIVDADRHWFGNRMRDAHDLWHTVTGYGMDEAGEGGLLAFTYAQVPNPGIGLIVLAAIVHGPWSERLRWPRYLLSAWRRGRATPWLATARWEELLPLPMPTVQARLGIPRRAEAHPRGRAVAIGAPEEPRIEYRSALVA